MNGPTTQEVAIAPASLPAGDVVEAMRREWTRRGCICGDQMQIAIREIAPGVSDVQIAHLPACPMLAAKSGVN